MTFILRTNNLIISRDEEGAVTAQGPDDGQLLYLDIQADSFYELNGNSGMVKLIGIGASLGFRVSVLRDIHKAVGIAPPAFESKDQKIRIEFFQEVTTITHNTFGKFEFYFEEDNLICYDVKKDVFLEGYSLAEGLFIYSSYLSNVKFEVATLGGRTLDIKLLTPRSIYA